MTRETRARRFARPVALGLLVGATLTGCETFPGDPMAIKLSGDDAVLVVCESLTADGLYMEQRIDSKWSVFWDSEGPLLLGSDHELLLVESVAVAHGETIFTRPSLEPGDRITVGIDFGDSPRAGDFAIPPEGLQQTDWLRTDGSTSKWPCAAQEWRNTERDP